MPASVPETGSRHGCHVAGRCGRDRLVPGSLLGLPCSRGHSASAHARASWPALKSIFAKTSTHSRRALLSLTLGG